METLEKSDILKIVKNLYEIYTSAKALHWASTDFGEHLLYDRVADGILDYIDEVAETVAIPFYDDFIIKPEISEYTTISAYDLAEMLYLTILMLEEYQKYNNVMESVKTILSNISSDLLKKRMFITQNIIK